MTTLVLMLWDWKEEYEFYYVNNCLNAEFMYDGRFGVALQSEET